MKYLKISNKGELPINIISLMGGSTKSDDPEKIGQWGSGLKYAIAYFTRKKIDFKIFIGEKELKITTSPIQIREKEFNIIYINGEKTSLTTQMGGDAWSEWQCIREIWSNAIDEEDHFRGTSIKPFGTEGYTTFYIEMTPNVLSVWNTWSKYFIDDQEPLYEYSNYKLYPSVGGTLKIYKQGVLILEKDKPSVFSYDIKDASINELREYRGVISSDLVSAIMSIKDKETLNYFLETITEDHYEAQLDYAFWGSMVFWDTWNTVLGNARIIHKKAKENLLSNFPNADLTNVVEVPKNFLVF